VIHQSFPFANPHFRSHIQDDLLLAKCPLFEFNPRDFSLSGYFSMFNTNTGTVDDLKEAVEQEVFSVSTARSQAALMLLFFFILRPIKCKNN
jgi:hypothetical protein